VVALECAARTGTFAVETRIDQLNVRRDVLAECRRLETQLAEERAAIKKETQFNRQVERNIRIKQMERELKLKTAAL